MNLEDAPKIHHKLPKVNNPRIRPARIRPWLPVATTGFFIVKPWLLAAHSSFVM